MTSLSSGTTAAASQEELDSESGRRALRRVAAGVTVLTVNNDGLRHGTTVSAVVALSRTPLVLGVCLRASSTFTAMVRKAGVFSVNVLNDQQGHLARQFAAPGRSHGDAQFEGVEWTADALTGAPLIGGSLAHLACALSDCRQIGDHDLLTADVLDGEPGSGSPLLTFAGRLHPEGVPDLGASTRAGQSARTTN
ncbi:flavin reductase family protein [Streptomyces sp. NPDC004980]